MGTFVVLPKEPIKVIQNRFRGLYLTMREFVDEYAKKDLVEYQPENLEKGDEVVVYIKERWIKSIFLSYYNENWIYVIPDYTNDKQCVGTWVRLLEE